MKNLLPIGSVVLLKDATKKLVIIGILQVNPSENKIYEYVIDVNFDVESEL